jgi:hypothetical protein
MADWIFDRKGSPTLIFDGDCIRNHTGMVLAWVQDNNVYSMQGQHRGWFEEGILYDAQNRIIGFTEGATGRIPSKPDKYDAIEMPKFADRPERIDLKGTPGRPGHGGWSEKDLSTYFNLSEENRDLPGDTILLKELELAEQAAKDARDLATKIIQFAAGVIPAIIAIAVALVQLNGGIISGGTYNLYELSYGVKGVVNGLLGVAAVFVLLASLWLNEARVRYVEALRTAAGIRLDNRIRRVLPIIPSLINASERGRLEPFYNAQSGFFFANLMLGILLGGTMAAWSAWLVVTYAPAWSLYTRTLVLGSILAFFGFGTGLQIWFIRALLSKEKVFQEEPVNDEQRDQKRRFRRTAIWGACVGAFSLALIGADFGIVGGYVLARGFDFGKYFGGLIHAQGIDHHVTLNSYYFFSMILSAILLFFLCIHYFDQEIGFKHAFCRFCDLLQEGIVQCLNRVIHAAKRYILRLLRGIVSLDWFGYKRMDVARFLLQIGSITWWIFITAITTAIIIHAVNPIQSIHQAFNAPAKIDNENAHIYLTDIQILHKDSRYFSGIAFLPDGAKISAQLISDSNNSVIAALSGDVLGNMFSISALDIVHKPLPPGKYKWVLEFRPQEQNDEVKQIVGEKGEWLGLRKESKCKLESPNREIEYRYLSLIKPPEIIVKKTQERSKVDF